MTEQRAFGIRMVLATQVTNASTGIGPSQKAKIGHKILQGSNPSKTARTQAFNDEAGVPFIIGCTSLIGRPGIAVGAIVMMLFANPLSAAAVPYQFIAQPWGAIGQFLPPGAANWLIRTLSYFPDADTSKQWWVLTSWLTLGVVLALIGHYRSRQSMHVPEASLDGEPHHAQHAS